MGRRRVEQRNVRKLTRSGGGSMYVTLPVEFIRNLGWRERQNVVVEQKGKTLVIRDWE